MFQESQFKVHVVRGLTVGKKVKVEGTYWSVMDT